jgi:NAD(P)-dependent dehydrogenase (short-subunit alcohol dehydrogenase family)
MRLKDRVAVITGGGSGIGAATASLFGRHGASVAVLDVNRKAASGVAAQLRRSSAQAIALWCDVSREDSVAKAMWRVAAEFGSIDVLVNNAGVAVRHSLSDLASPDWEWVIKVNLQGAFLCSKHALQYFPGTGGSIVHMSSVTGITGVRNRAAYSASKGGIVALTRSMAMDYAARQIRVNCVCPGFVRTPMTAPLLSDPQHASRLEALHPMGRLGEPDDIANAILFLASDESAWMTGQTLVVDGGFSAGRADDI